MRTRANDAFRAFLTEGNPHDFAVMFDEVAPDLFRLAYYLADDRHDAEDLVQETFLVAIQKRRDFEPGSNVAAWLFGILTNRARELRRRRSRVLPQVRTPPGDELSPAEVAEAVELKESVAQAVDNLPEHYASALRAHLLLGLSVAEIATILSRPTGTVRTQIVRGMEALRAALPTGLGGVGVAVAAVGGVAQPAMASLARIRDAVSPRTCVKGSGVGAGALAIAGMVLQKSALLVTGGVAVGGVVLVMALGPGHAADSPPMGGGPSSAAIAPTTVRALTGVPQGGRDVVAVTPAVPQEPVGGMVAGSHSAQPVQRPASLKTQTTSVLGHVRFTPNNDGKQQTIVIDLGSLTGRVAAPASRPQTRK